MGACVICIVLCRCPSLAELKREAERLTALAEEKTQRLDSITQQVLGTYEMDSPLVSCFQHLLGYRGIPAVECHGTHACMYMYMYMAWILPPVIEMCIPSPQREAMHLICNVCRPSDSCVLLSGCGMLWLAVFIQALWHTSVSTGSVARMFVWASADIYSIVATSGCQKPYSLFHLVKHGVCNLSSADTPP